MTFKNLTDKQIEFLKRFDSRTRKEAHKAFVAEYGCDVPFNTFKAWMNKLNITASGDGRFDGTQTPWAKGLKGEAFWSRYSDESRKRMMDAPVQANKTARIGDVHIKNGEPYMVVSLDYSKPFHERREPLRRVVWEKHHGEVPKDSMVVHLNGNRLDCRIENLAVIPKSYRPIVLRHMKSDEPEITKAVIRYCELLETIKKARQVIE